MDVLAIKDKTSKGFKIYLYLLWEGRDADHPSCPPANQISFPASGKFWQSRIL